jgi:hypothetical protein
LSFKRTLHEKGEKKLKFRKKLAKTDKSCSAWNKFKASNPILEIVVKSGREVVDGLRKLIMGSKGKPQSEVRAGLTRP